MNDNKTNKTINTYSFTISFKVGGIVDSILDLEGAKAKLSAELTDFYGEEGFEIIDFHVSTPEEIAEYAAFLADNTDETIN